MEDGEKVYCSVCGAELEAGEGYGVNGKGFYVTPCEDCLQVSFNAGESEGW